MIKNRSWNAVVVPRLCCCCCGCGGGGTWPPFLFLIFHVL